MVCLISSVHISLLKMIVASGSADDPNVIPIDGNELKSSGNSCIVNNVHPP